MSLEPGGRSDKYGNQYENQYLAKLLLRVVSEEYKSVVVEPLGENRDSLEFIATDHNDICWYFQCKASDGTHTKWSLADLERYDIFNRSKLILDSSPKNRYVFVSPLAYGELDELCKRAGTNGSVSDFKNYQLNNTTIKKLFNDCYLKDGSIIYKADPFAFSAELRPGTASRIWDISGYLWHDRVWLEKRRKVSHFDRPMNIYEVHAGSWKRHADGSVYTYEELAKMFFAAAGKEPVIKTAPTWLFDVLAWVNKQKKNGKEAIIKFSKWTLTEEMVGDTKVGDASFAEYIKNCYKK